MIEHAYIHIPFCLRKCKYCSFVSGKNINDKEKYLNSLYREIEKRYQKDKLKTLYIGGGTPSLLEPEEIKQLISFFSFQEKPEITLEINPETINHKKMDKFISAGINRVSLGVQTFNNEILKSIGRNHNESDITNAINIIKNAGIKNTSIDLIYGLPNQNLSLLSEDIEKAISLNIQHISLYGLKIEENSYFYEHTPDNIPSDELQAEMFLHICQKLKEANFTHYEISNFAKEGYESKHNCAYWKNKNYYGFGLNASGYENKTRYRNSSNFNSYILSPLKKEEENILSTNEIVEEEIFLALRLKNGIDIKEINQKFNINFEQKYKSIIHKYSELELLKIKNNHCFLTEKGFLLSNEIMSEFLD